MKKYMKFLVIPALFAMGIMFTQSVSAQAPAESNTKVEATSSKGDVADKASKESCKPGCVAACCAGKASATATGASKKHSCSSHAKTSSTAKSCHGSYKTASYKGKTCSGKKMASCTPGCEKSCCAGSAKGTATGASKK